MVANLVRLRLRLTANAMRKSVWQTIGYIIGILYALTLVGTLLAALIAGSATEPELTHQLMIIVGSVAVLAWWLVPIFAFGVDATLDPQRFVFFSIPRRTLLLGLTAAGFTTIPGAATLIVGVGSAATWWRTPLVIPLGLLGGLLAVCTCVVGSRALTTALVPLLESRRSREVLTVVAIIPLIMIGPAMGALASHFDEGSISTEALAGFVGTVADVFAWTPLGAAWGMPAAAATGAWGLAGARLLIAVAALALAWTLWDKSLAKALVTPPSPSSQSGKVNGIGLFGKMPATPAGAVAARALTYWFRDPRYSAGLAVIPLMPVIFIIAGGGISGVLLVSAPVVAWILAFSISADIAYDNTAFALHIVTGVRGRDDRLGRVMAVALFGGLVLLVLLFGSLIATGRWDLAPAMFGTTFGVFGGTLGVSSVTSARLIYPVAKPGTSPMKQPQGSAMAQMLSQMVGMALAIAICIPVLVFLVLTLLVSPLFSWITFLVGIAGGMTACLLGIRWGGRIFDRRGPEILQQIIAQP